MVLLTAILCDFIHMHWDERRKLHIIRATTPCPVALHHYAALCYWKTNHLLQFHTAKLSCSRVKCDLFAKVQWTWLTTMNGPGPKACIIVNSFYLNEERQNSISFDKSYDEKPCSFYPCHSDWFSVGWNAVKSKTMWYMICFHCSIQRETHWERKSFNADM